MSVTQRDEPVLALAKRIGRRYGDGRAAPLDPVAYVRFASVYRYFREVEDFEQLIGELDERHSEG